jgi:hypothetical protein
MTGFSQARKEKLILQQAENDPFPSPADVGLDDSGDRDDPSEK